MADEAAIRYAVAKRRQGMLTPGIVAKLVLKGVDEYDAFLAAKAAKILASDYRPNVRWIRDYS